MADGTDGGEGRQGALTGRVRGQGPVLWTAEAALKDHMTNPGP